LHGLRPGDLEMRQSADRAVQLNSAVVDNFLKLGSRFATLVCDKKCLAAHSLKRGNKPSPGSALDLDNHVQLIGNRRVAVGGCLIDLMALARFLPKDALLHTLRFLVDGVAPLNVALQCETARPALRWHGPFVVHVLQLLAVHLVGTALPEIQLCSFSLHCSLLRVFWFCPP
jgi:hypothetical protein